MVYVLYSIFFISCLVLVAAVLLQPGKTDAGALFTSNVSSAAFGPRGTASVLSKLTIVAAVIFMLSALMLSMPALTGSVSVLQSTTEAPAEQQQLQPVNTSSQTVVIGDTNSNVSTAPANTNSNGALVETPATNSFEQKAENSNTAAPANK